MIGYLPKQLNVNGIERAIWSDFRTALLIFQGFSDEDMSDEEKTVTMVECLYQEPESISPEDYRAAADQAAYFLEGGKEISDNQRQLKKTMDWEQDEQLIFAAVNKVAGYEIRTVDYLHWWTFLGFFNEIGEGLFTTVINIRSKKNKGKKLEKYEQEFYRDNKSLIDIKVRITPEERAEREYWNKILG